MKIHGTLILCLILVILVAIIYSQNQKETFTDSLVSPYMDSVYKDQGIELCDVLSSSNYMARNYVDSLRIMKWKPSEKDPQYNNYIASQKDHDYCFFFAESDKGLLKVDSNLGYMPVKDPLASFSNCSKDNSLFKDTSFITDVFESTGFDKTHRLPYKKCVLQINKQNANDSNVNAFWDGFSGGNNQAFCQGMVNALQNEVNGYKNKVDEVNKNLKPYHEKYKSTTQLMETLQKCKKDNIQLEKNLNDNTKKLKELQAKIDNANKKYSTLTDDARKQLDKINIQLNQKESELLGLKNKNQYVLEIDLENLQNNISSYTIKRDGCTKELNTVTEKYNQVANDHNNVMNIYKKITIDLGQCEKKLRELLGNIDENKPIKANYVKQLIDIQDNLFKCLTEQERLKSEEAYWKSRLEQVTKDLQECSKELANLLAEIETLKTQREALINEIEDIKRRCRNDQSQFNLATVEMHREAAREIINTEQQRCAASIAMRKRKVELLNEINGILLQANSCDRVIAACKCYKRIADFGWNDEGTSVSRAKTSSGRIVEIRKYIQAAPFIQFTGADGNKTQILRLTRTRKKKGGGSYVDVAGAITVGGLRGASMFAQV
jgi:uncharacterized coiled-coil DUF342 family protein